MKKLGSNLDVKGIVIHQLNKSAGIRNVGFKKAKKALSIGDREKAFISKLNESYRKKSNPTYGIFGDGNPTFKDLLENYLQTDKFYDFTVNAASHYKTTLENTITATGGFLIFIDFFNQENDHRYLFILTITNKDGFVVSEEDLTLKDIKNLDLSKVDVACMINLSTWKNIEDGTDADSKTYLSFIKGKKGISYYFMSFINCDNKTTNTESTKRLTRALDAYTKENNYDRKLTIEIKNLVFEHCTKCIKERKEIQLTTISALINPDDTTKFQEFAASEEYGVSEVIKGDSNQLRLIKYVKYRGEKYKLEFDKDLLGKDIFYNKQRNELTFKRVPDELTEQIPF